MDFHTIAIILGAAAATATVVKTAVRPVMYLRRQRQVDPQKIRGEILHPRDGDVVAPNCKCDGTIDLVPSTISPWLVVEIAGPEGTYFWPKEGNVVRRKDGTWSHTVFHDGRPRPAEQPQPFAISLWVTTGESSRRIAEWFDRGNESGRYPALHDLGSESHRLARVSGLRKGEHGSDDE